MKVKYLYLFLMLILIAALGACNGLGAGVTDDPPTPTVDPDIYNQVPDTTVFEPGQCTAVLEVPAPAHTSSTLAATPSGEIAAGAYEVGVAADYGSSLWYGLNGVSGPNYVNSANVSALEGDCTLDSE